MTTFTDAQRERRSTATTNLRVNLSRLGNLPDVSSPPTPEDREPGIDLKPTSAYEAVTRQKVDSLADDLREIKSRLNNLVFVIAGGILLDVIGRMLGIGT
ncbi:MAG TPA: hypothetical protein VFQ54_08385 [Thermomicrobiales bacterium]|nr:hypothetical protein [Thermomicrobiales bacterium]